MSISRECLGLVVPGQFKIEVLSSIRINSSQTRNLAVWVGYKTQCWLSVAWAKRLLHTSSYSRAQERTSHGSYLARRSQARLRRTVQGE